MACIVCGQELEGEPVFTLDSPQCPVCFMPVSRPANIPMGRKAIREVPLEVESARPRKPRRMSEAVPLDSIRHDPIALEEAVQQERIRLDIGAGPQQISGWLSVDMNEAINPDIVADARSLPFEDDVVDEICAFHVLEHMDWQGGLDALYEWLRVLKPGGGLTVAVPDVVEIYHMFKKGCKWGHYQIQMNEKYIQAVVFGSNILANEIPEMMELYGGPGMDHHSLYIYDMLPNRVIEAGYDNVRVVTMCFLRPVALGEVMVQANKPKGR